MACACSAGKTTLIYACSGAANTGLLADQVARQLSKDKAGAMTCLAAIGANLSGFLTSARSADMNVVIDGCPVACGKKQFDAQGIAHAHFIITIYGVEKGQTAITGEVIAETTAKIAAEISAKVCG
jgi:uncharacterized metal-binding protein